MANGNNDSATFGKYRVIAELGHGGMADVYLAVVQGPVGFNKLVVIKQLRPHLAENPEFLEMFLDEARLAARLNHPNVVQTNEVVEEGSRYFIAMEYLDGQSFDRVLRRAQKRGGGVGLTHRLRVLIEVLAGLHYAHELADFDGTPLQVVHRDVTPHNVFITYEGQIKVVDFGIAKAANSSAETRTGVLKGKVAYMSPEQACGDELDRRADIFSAGLMLWECVTGERAWKGLNDIQILNRLAQGQIPSMKTVAPDAPAALIKIVDKAIAASRDDRYATAADMRADLERHLEQSGQTVTARDVGNQVSALFDDKRAEIKVIIDNQLKALRAANSESGLMPVRLTTQTMSMPIARLGVDPTTGSSQVEPHEGGSGPSTSQGMQPSSSSIPSETSLPKPSPKKTWLVVASAVGVAAVVGVGMMLSSQSTPARAASSAAAAPPAPDQSAGPGAPSVQVVDVTLSATPAEAKIFFDDAPLPNNPFTGKFPRDGASHRVRAEAPGFTPRTQLIILSENVKTELTLTKADDPTPAATSQQGGKGTSRPAGPAAQAAPAQPTSDALPPPKVDRNNAPKRQLDNADPWK